MLKASRSGIAYIGRFIMTTVLVGEDELINWRVFQKILTKVGGLDANHTEDEEEVTICTCCPQSQQQVTTTSPQCAIAPHDSHNNRYSGNRPATCWHRNT